MEKKPNIINILNQEEYTDFIMEIYQEYKDFLDEELNCIDDDTMLSYIKAYMTNIYENLNTEIVKGIFILSLRERGNVADLINSFIIRINATKAKMGDLIDKETLTDLEELKKYKDTEIYREISKSNKEIAKMINEFHGYVTINELKKRAIKKSSITFFEDYQITEDEIEILERTKKYYIPNQLAHLLYDEQSTLGYICDHEVRSDDELLKKLLVTTNKENPRYEIIFPDGMILDYFMGDIRVKPYNYKQIIEYTKLFYAANYEEMKEFFGNVMGLFGMKEDNTSYEIGRQMIINSYINVFAILHNYENIYTQKMIDDSKEEIVKIKKIAKEYDL